MYDDFRNEELFAIRQKLNANHQKLIVYNKKYSVYKKAPPKIGGDIVYP